VTAPITSAWAFACLGVRAAEHLERRQALQDIEEMTAEAAEQHPLLARLGLRMQADEHGEARDERQGYPDHHRGHPVGEADPDKHGNGNQAGEHELRQVAGEVGVETVQPSGGERGDLPGLLPAEPARAKAQRVRGEHVQVELAEAVARRLAAAAAAT
jgi:hypothetical protein